MNFLAHVYLADGDDAFLVGNLMGDFVRGRPDPELPTAIRAGIRLHRQVDRFTDEHPTTRTACRRLPRYRRRVAGVIVDLAYDHFLARDWAYFSSEPLAAFSARVYRTLEAHYDYLPPRLARLLPAMRDGDWLTAYARLENTAHALDRMAYRLRRPELLQGTLPELRAAYPHLDSDFHAFFPQLIRYVQARGHGAPINQGSSQQ